jgi:glyoxylase-like metal-dependent hydrolase (beta-lactamase superfamily II)
MATPKLTRQNVSEPPIPLNVYIHRASTPGIGTLSTLIVGEESAVLIDVPLLNEDAKSFVAWIKEKTNVPISAIFVSHHHPDHYWSNDIIRAAWPAAKLYAAPYICDDINREIEAKKPFLISWLKDRVSQNPTMPEPYPFSFFVLKGNPSSPIVIMGPVQGDCINSTIFWLPVEKVVVCGDTMFGRNTHVWYE